MKKAYNLRPKTLLIGLCILLGTTQKTQTKSYSLLGAALPAAYLLVGLKLTDNCLKKQWSDALLTCSLLGAGYYAGRQLPYHDNLKIAFPFALFRCSNPNDSHNMGDLSSILCDYITGLLLGELNRKGAKDEPLEEPEKEANPDIP